MTPPPCRGPCLSHKPAQDPSRAARLGLKTEGCARGGNADVSGPAGIGQAHAATPEEVQALCGPDVHPTSQGSQGIIQVHRNISIYDMYTVLSLLVCISPGVSQLLTSLDRGYYHQGCWSWGGDVAGTAGSRTWLKCKAEGQETLPARLPTSAGVARHMRVAVCLQMQTNGLLYL